MAEQRREQDALARAVSLVAPKSMRCGMRPPRRQTRSLSRALVIALKWCVRLAKLARTAHCAGGGMLVNYLERAVLRARKSATAQTTRHHVMREPIACSTAFNSLRKTEPPLCILN
jgi:hypothetical protein